MDKFLIDPTKVINYNRTDSELELWWLFSISVAGKTATTQARLLNNLMYSMTGDTPFEKIYNSIQDNSLLDKLIESRLGQYNRLVRSFSESLQLNLRTCDVHDLENIFGIGPKTARMFLMMSRPKQRYAALDTHVLKHLKEYGHDVPKSTPSKGDKYFQLEQIFIDLADKNGMEVSEYDLMVWKKYAKV